MIVIMGGDKMKWAKKRIKKILLADTAGTTVFVFLNVIIAAAAKTVNPFLLIFQGVFFFAFILVFYLFFPGKEK